MAARPPKPPDSSTHMVKQQSPAESSEDSYKCLQNEKSDCSCTNISIMQLFHEMKQIFPTVPDHVVNQCVIENCHDRENCIENLNNELATHPNTAQAYPSHVLRGGGGIGNHQQISGGILKKPLIPTRPAPAPKPNYCDPKQIPKHAITPTTPTTPSGSRIHQEIGTKIAPTTGNTSDTRITPTINNSDSKKPNVPQRPTTLSFRDPPPSHLPTSRQLNQPRRTAPPPPAIKHTPSPQPPPPQLYVQNTINEQNHNFNATSSVQSPLSFSDSGESEISVNISLSPSSSDRSRSVGGCAPHPTRRISSISVQPEPPYTRDFTTATTAVTTPQSPRSYTSLNLTLRKPSSTPQPPIDITAGPGLTYSSSSFDAKLGYQQNFHITVTDGGGSVSSCRIRPRSCYSMTAQHRDSEFSPNPEQSNPLRTGISMPNVAQHTTLESERFTAVGDHQIAANNNIIQRQQHRKSKLAKELGNKRELLQKMDREINLLQSPIPPNELERLDWEIQTLRYDCDKLWQEFERVGAAAGIPLENVYENIYNGQQLPPQRPPRQRPPLPPSLSRLDPQHLSRPTQHQSSSSSSPIQTPTIPNFHPTSYPLASSSVPNQSYDDGDYANGNFADGNGPSWPCSMCTFQNNPLLNKCEECDNVRIIPGTVQIIPSSLSSSTASASQFGSLLSVANPPPPSNNNFINNNNNHSLNAIQRNANNNNHNNSNIENNANNNSRRPINPLVAYPSIMNPISAPNANFVIPQ